MDNNEFHNVKGVSFADRESFNNTIILLTMVKSKCYYIVGFSRESGYITIAFDYESDIHNTITEYLTIDFQSNDIVLKSELMNIGDVTDDMASSKYIKVVNDKVLYEKHISKDNVFPIGTRQMHKEILSAKFEIYDYIEKYYNCLING